MKNELVKINPKDFGIEESKAKQIADQFKPMLDKMVELEEEANEVFKLDIESLEAAKQAKEVRLKYVKVRTGTSEIHKEQKAFYLQAGRFVDGWKNAQLFASQGIEEKLMQIEKYAENKEKERLENLQRERIILVEPYLESVEALNLSSMSEEVFTNFLQGSKTNYENKLESERLEKERLEAERLAEIERQKAIEAENAKLKIEAEAKEKALAKERAEAKEKLDAIELKAKQEREEAENKRQIEAAKQAKIQAEKDAEIKRIAKELQDKKDAEIKAETERKLAEENAKKEAEKAAKAPIKDQLNIWVENFKIDLPNSELLNNEKALLIKSKFDAFKKWAKNEVESL